jgi:type VI protein secretion system component VasF
MSRAEARRARRRATITMWTVLGILAAYVFLTVLWLHG